MRTTRNRADGHSLRAWTVTLALALSIAVPLVTPALVAGREGPGKSAKPGKPTAKAPQGVIIQATPTFTWNKASGAARYELRVSEGSQLLLKKTGITKLSWTTGTALPTDVDLSWKIRASSARGTGAWSKSLKFTVVSLAIGDSYGGGTVAYILQSGDPGYVAGETHGLVAATADQSSGLGIRWNNGAYVVTGATETGIGTGSANTTAIIAVQGGTPTTYAAGLARAYAGGGYADWYLPSKDELNALRLNRDAIGGLSGCYWCSTENDYNSAWNQCASTGNLFINSKDQVYRVRAVRTF
jgi:hypothetical protein